MSQDIMFIKNLYEADEQEEKSLGGKLYEGIKNSSQNIYEVLRQYESALGTDERKNTGSFYTDKSIIKFMLKHTLLKIDITIDPYIKVLDPSCGCGYFLLEAYDILKQKFISSLNRINEIFPHMKLTYDSIHEHILKHNIFGADCDPYAVKLASMALMLKEPESTCKPNVICCDSVIDWENTLFEYRDFWGEKYDFIIGNPPYIGHKKISGEYRKRLKSIYGDVFRDKADLSFCFIKSSIERLREGGTLCFITSRYFMESPSGKDLRKYIVDNCIVEKIVDFYGVRIMKGISVDPVIVFLKKYCDKRNHDVSVLKAQMTLKNLDSERLFQEIESDGEHYFQRFFISQKSLNNDGWILRRDEELSIIKKIELKSAVTLSSICSSFQGIITGCDKAFIINDSMEDELDLEKNILRRWIKNSHIEKYKVKSTNLKIIYSDFIDHIDNYNKCISYIEKYKNRLSKRRECAKGYRLWYQLQWGRESRLFEMRKIVFPYKSSCSRFAIDEGSYSSADVYGMYIKDEYKGSVSYEFLLGLLNSKLYEFYFKSFGKKLGDELYDYYPNTVMRLMVPNRDDHYIKKEVDAILRSSDQAIINCCIKTIDDYVYKMFDLSPREIQIVEQSCLK